MSLRPLLPVMIALGLMLAAPAGARPSRDGRDEPPYVENGPETLAPARRSLSPEDAAREVQRRHGGRILAVQPDGAGYRVRVLKNGEVRIYQINP
ncbi:MAG TPA: hypothetical protein VFV11_05765 [Solimonas sp.]|nr:hypothetical protein [Solimonas sp.]